MDDITATSMFTKHNMTLLIVTGGVVLTAHFLKSLYHNRLRRYVRFPQLPATFLWGHLKALDGFYRRRELDRHPGMSTTPPNKQLGC